jgi:hypothetical protein
VPPAAPDAAAAGLDRILGDAGFAARLGARALDQARALTWDRRADAIKSFLEQRLAVFRRG